MEDITTDMDTGDSDSNSTRKTSTVNIEDSRFTVDGVFAEMIIEVDEEHLESPTRQFQVQELINAEQESSSKADFVRTLGLGNTSDPTDALNSVESDVVDLIETLNSDSVNNPSRKKTIDAEESTVQNASDVENHSDILTKKGEKETAQETSLRKARGRPRKKGIFTVVKKRAKPEEANLSLAKPPEKKLKLREAKVVLQKLELPASSGQGVKFADIDHIRTQVRSSQNKNYMKILFKVLYDGRPPMDHVNLCYQILQFNGFPFKKTSPKFAKRREILNKLQLNILYKISSILNIAKDEKSVMITNILTMLLKPFIRLDPSKDPAYQPVVVIEYLDYALLSATLPALQRSDIPIKIKTEVTEVTPRKKPGRPPKSKYKNALSQSHSTKNQTPVWDDSLAIFTSGGRNTRNSLSSQITASEVSGFKRKSKTATPQRKGSLSPWSRGIALPFKKRKLVLPVSPAEKPIKLEPLSPRSESPSGEKIEDMGFDIEAVGSLDLTQFTSIGGYSPEKKSETGKAFDMQRRSADKRRRPSHFGEWIQDETERKRNVIPKVSGPKSMKRTMVTLKNKMPKPQAIKKIRRRRKGAKLNTAKVKAPDVQEETAPGDDDYDTDINDVLDYEDYVNQFEERDTDSQEAEITDSASEGKGVSNETEESQTENSSAKIKGVKLSSFPVVASSMRTITNAALQRLHVILFGTSSQPNVMKRNILDFHGFPFDDNSEEYQQKHFFLSLLASNNIAEVFEALHIGTSDSSQTGLVDTLMQFLMSPRLELLDKKSQEVKKTLSKKIPDKPLKGPRNRKVLMDEATYRKLELEIAREQRIRRRADLLAANALKARVAASSPKKVAPVQEEEDVQVLFPVSDSNVRIKLGESPHIQFMIVALSYFDLEVLHHVLFLHGACKAKIRRNILDFRGFTFDELSPRYKARLTIMKHMGFEMVQRIAFILGLTPMDCKKNMHHLAELIMQFLISPSRMKQVPIKEFPENFIMDCPKEFDKKAIFADIPDFQQVLQMEFGNTPDRCEYIVKNVSDPKFQSELLKKKTVALTETVAPVAEVKTSDKVRPTEPVNPLVKQVHKSTTSLGQMIAVRSGDDKNVSYHIIQNHSAKPGNKLLMVQKGGGYVLQEVSPTGVKQHVKHPKALPIVQKSPQKLMLGSVLPKSPLGPSAQTVLQGALLQEQVPQGQEIFCKEKHNFEATQQDSQRPVLSVASKITKNFGKKSLQAPNITSSIVVPRKKVVRPPNLPPGQAFLLDPAKVKQVMKSNSVGDKPEQGNSKNLGESSGAVQPKHHMITKINLSQAIQQKKMAQLADSPTHSASKTTPVVTPQSSPKATATFSPQPSSPASPSRYLTDKLLDLQAKALATQEVSKSLLSTPSQDRPAQKRSLSLQEELQELKKKSLALQRASESLARQKALAAKDKAMSLKENSEASKDGNKSLLSSPRKNTSSPSVTTLSPCISSLQPPASLPQTILLNSPSLSHTQSPGFFIQNTLGSSSQPQIPILLLQKPGDGQSGPQTILMQTQPTILVPVMPSSTGTTGTTSLLQPPTFVSAPSSSALSNSLSNLSQPIMSIPGLPQFTMTNQNRKFVEGEKFTVLKLSQPITPTTESEKVSTTTNKLSATSGQSVNTKSTFVPSITSVSKSNVDSSSSAAVDATPTSDSEGDEEMETEETNLLVESAEKEAEEDLMIVHNQPSDSILFEKILDMIHGADLTELTFKNIIERLVSEFPGLDVKSRRFFIKSSVKNIVCGDSSF